VETVGLDNVVLASVSAPIPEPSTLTLITLAGITLGMVRHNRQARQPKA